MEQKIIKAKRIECVIGLFLLIPAILGEFAFLLQFIFEADTDFSELHNLNEEWANTTPVYLGLVALAGAYLIKDSIIFLFNKNEN